MSELKVALTDVPSNLNPYESNTLHIHTVMWPIYEPLFDIGDKGQLIARLAASWDVSADGLTYVFRLRNGVTFYPGGTPFAAQSVVDNLLQVKRRTSFRERILADLIDLNNVKAVNTNMVSVQLKYPKPELLFLALMTSPHADKSKPPLGTGPFYLEAADHSGFVLKKKPNYLPQPAQLDQITFKKIRPTDLMDEFKEGRVDFIRDVDPESVRDIPGDQTEKVRPFGLHYLGFNLGSTLFGKLEVRRTFRDTIDFAQIQSKTGLDSAEGPIPPGVEAYDPTLSTPHQNRADARTVLEETCRGSVITLLFNNNSYYGLELANRIARDLAESNVAVKLEPKESSSELLKEIKKRGHGEKDNYVFIYNWYSILPAAEIFLRPLFESGMPDNLTGYTGVDALLEATREPKILAKDRTDRYRDAQRKIVDDAPTIFLGHSRVRYSARSARVTGLRLNVQSFPVDRYAGVYV